MTRRQGAAEPEIARDRRRLVDHLDQLEKTDVTIPCRRVDAIAASAWTSEAIEEQQIAARACAPCPARTECQLFGLRWPDLYGVYGALTDPQRRPRARQKRDTP